MANQSGYVISLDIDGWGQLAERRDPACTHAFSLEQVVGGSLDFNIEGPGIPVLFQLNEAGRVQRVVPVDPRRDTILTPAA
jgi:hypothetical protein